MVGAWSVSWMMVLKVSNLLSAWQLREQVCPNVAFPWYVVHLKAIEIIDKGLYDMIVSKQHYLLGMILV